MNRVAHISRRGRIAAATGLLAAFAATASVVSPAQAADLAPAAPAQPYATVTTTAGLNERQFPSTDSSIKGALQYREQVGLLCKVRAQNINGWTTWYLERDRRMVWISGAYVQVTGTVKYCKDVLYNTNAERAMPNAKG